MKRLISIFIAVLVLASASGCGPYRIRYTMPSKQRSGMVVTKTHAHGLGPGGGGAYFFALNQMLPCPVDYTGPMDIQDVCPNGFSEISHYHTFGQNAGAAFLSWLVLVNAFHQSTVEYQHAVSTARPARTFASTDLSGESEIH